MGVTLKKTTGPGSFAGGPTAISSYSIVEDATPRIPGDTSGGVGSITVGGISSTDSILLSGAGIEVNANLVGRALGTVRGIEDKDGELTITADSQLAQLVVTRKAQAYNGTLGGAFAYYFGLVGITSGYTVDSTITARPVTYTGFNDNIWTFLKNICSAEQVEITLVNGTILVRPMRHDTVDMHRNSSVSFKVDTGNIALSAEVYYYNTQYISNGQVYPSSTSDLIIDVPQGETITQNVQTDVSLTSVMQPVPSTDSAQAAIIAADGGIKKSFYFVHDGWQEVAPATWTNMGGSVTVAINPDDDTQLTITARAPVSPTVSSYRLAFGIQNLDTSDTTNNSGSNFSYGGGLVIVGTGVRTNKQLVIVPTGANPAFVTDDKAPTVDNPAIRTQEQAYAAARAVAAAYAGPSLTVGVDAARVHGDDWDMQSNPSPANAFAHQVLGNIAGARVPYRNNILRVTSATVSDNGISYSAERDTIIEDFNSVWSGASFDDFNAAWAGYTFDDFSVMPLRRNG